MKYIKILAKKQIMFHGTSDKFLKSILKHGIIPSKNKVWTGVKESFEGVYFSKQLSKAIVSSHATSDIYGGKTLIVVAQIETTSPFTYMDEDDLYDIFNQITDIHAKDDDIYEIIEIFEKPKNEYFQEFLKEIGRYLSKKQIQFIKKYQKEFEFILNNYLKEYLIELGHYEFEVAEYRETLNNFLKKLKSMASNSRNIRLPKVGYKGANKIIGIFRASLFSKEPIEFFYLKDKSIIKPIVEHFERTVDGKIEIKVL